jgi:hypothetical protein
MRTCTHTHQIGTWYWLVGWFVHFCADNDTEKMMIATGGVESGHGVRSSSSGGGCGGAGSSSSGSSFLNEISTFIQNCEEL